MDKTYRKTPLIWRPPPHQLVQPMFAKKVCGKPEVIKGLSIFLEKSLNEHFKNKEVPISEKKDSMETDDDENLESLPEEVEKILEIFQQVEKKKLEFELKEEYLKLLQKHLDKLYEKNSSSSYSSRYLDHYPEDDTEHQENALFYKGLKKSQTEGGKVAQVHQVREEEGFNCFLGILARL
jgi:hypothetical protein